MNVAVARNSPFVIHSFHAIRTADNPIVISHLPFRGLSFPTKAYEHAMVGAFSMNSGTKKQMSAKWEERKGWDWSLSNCELARVYGTFPSGIRYIRLKLGIPKFKIIPKPKVLGADRLGVKNPPIGISQMEAEELERRFWDKVHVRGEDECWPWIRTRDQAGYGRLFTWTEKGTKTQRGAHRIAYALKNGGVPANKLVMHSCDNKWCCNPKHLSVGTDLDNSRDASVKGRMHPGERTFGTVLTDAIVHKIRFLSESGVGPNEIGRQLGIHRRTIADAVNGKTWRHCYGGN